jgi:hypothetical protein
VGRAPGSGRTPAVRSIRSDRRLAVALFTIGFGIAVVVVPDVSLRLLRILIGIAVIVWGLMDTGRPSMTGRSRGWAPLVRGLASTAVGSALIFWPEPTVSVMGVLPGSLVLLWGLIEIAASFAFRPTSLPTGQSDPGVPDTVSNAVRCAARALGR